MGPWGQTERSRLERMNGGGGAATPVGGNSCCVHVTTVTEEASNIKRNSINW